MPPLRFLLSRRTVAQAGARIDRFSLAAFTLPVLLFQAIEMTWRTYLPRFLHQDVGITMAAIAALALGARVLDALADLLLGWISDTVDTPLGRRKPWMAAGAILVAIGTPWLFMAPPGTSLTVILGASLLLHIGYSLIITPHGGWGLELSSDSHQLTRIMGAKVWFGLLGSLGLLAFLAFLERIFAFSLRVEMALLGSAIAILAPITVAVPILLFPERTQTARSAPVHPFHLIRTILGKPALRPILFLYLITGISDAAAASSFLFLTEDVMALERWSASLMLIQPVAALMTLPFWARMSARMDRRHLLALAYAWQACCATALVLVPSLAIAPFVLILVAKGLGWGIDYMLLRAMVADVAGKDADTAPLAACFYAISSVVMKLAMGLGAGGALWVIGWASEGMHMSAIRLTYCLPTIAGGMAAVAILLSGQKAVSRSMDSHPLESR